MRWGTLPKTFFYDPALLYFDRVWLKAYPWFFGGRSPEGREVWRRYRDEGRFREWTERSFDVYRSLMCIKVGLRKGEQVERESRCVDVLRYGERSFAPFTLWGRDLWVFDTGLQVTRDMVESLRLITRTDVVEGRPVHEKYFYLKLRDWLRVMVRPYVQGGRPYLVRVFVNMVDYSKGKLGLDFPGYVSGENLNWVDPERLRAEGRWEDFLRENRRLLEGEFKREMEELVRLVFTGFTGDREIELTVKVSSIELSFDARVSKVELVNALRYIEGRKTLKNDPERLEVGEGWDIGLKFYVTVDSGHQVKVYTKAVDPEGRVLNRLEITRNRVGVELKNLTWDVVMDQKTREILRRINEVMALRRSDVERLARALDAFIPVGVEDVDLYRSLLLDLFIHGSVKGCAAYRNVALTLKRKGLIEVRGRGRNSYYVLRPEYEVFRRTFLEELGLAGIHEKLLSPAIPEERHEEVDGEDSGE